MASAESASPRISTNVYLQLVHNKYGEFADSSDESLIDAGQATCDMFRSGRSADSIYDVMLVDDLGNDEGASLVAYSVRTFCPEYAGQVR